MSSRYDRQIPIIGEDGQKKLREAKVAIVGCGGLGSNTMTSLASAGIGSLVLIDYDYPDITNLNRQFVYRENQTKPKSESAGEWIKSLNPDVSVTVFTSRLDDGNAETLLARCNVLMDCLDSTEARKVLNRYAVRHGIPLVHGGVEGFIGQITVITPETPCLNCLMNHIADNRAIPSLGAAVSFIGSLQALEAIKLIAGVGKPLIGKLLVADMGCNSYEIVPILRGKGCEECNPSGTERRFSKEY